MTRETKLTCPHCGAKIEMRVETHGAGGGGSGNAKADFTVFDNAFGMFDKAFAEMDRAFKRFF